MEIIFPGKRARLFFNKYLSELNNIPVWAPTYYSINEYMEELSGLQLADNFTLLFELYEVYREVTGSNESFDDFYFYAEMLISDFDDIDKYLRDPKDVFKNLYELRNIENYYDYLNENQINVIKKFWDSFHSQRLSGEQKDFIHIWEALELIYVKFQNSLSGKNIAYEGMIYRKVTEMIKNGHLKKEKHIVCVGFNALNQCEKVLFSEIRKSGNGLFFWDYDDYYMKNEYHQAGRFINGNIKAYPLPQDFIFEADNFRQTKDIRFISTPSNIVQTKIINHCLNEMDLKTQEDYNKTAVVLTDEKLLLPVLYSLPDQLESFNVSMGYPFNNTPAYGLINILINLQKNRKKKNTEVLFFYKDVLSVINHQLIHNILLDDPGKTLNNRILDGNRIYIRKYELIDHEEPDHEVLNYILEEINQPAGLVNYLINIFKLLLNHSTKNRNNSQYNKLEREFLHFAIVSMNRISEILQNTKIELSLNTVIRIIRKVIQNSNIPFTGEPLEGLQIMGILETRGIDFENIIILSLNEGIFPKTSHVPSFIPPNLRYGFELPVMEDHDAIFAYYFYRLLQRAKTCYLVYNTNSEGLFTGERSRFLHQLEYETDFQIKTYHIDYDIFTSVRKEIIVKKTPEIQSILNNYLDDGCNYLSPSAINTFINCSLRFYFSYIRDLKEPDKIMEEIDPSEFGNILHNVLNDLYRPYIGRMINSEILTSIQKNSDTIDHIIKESILTNFYKSNSHQTDITGKNLIIQEIIKKYVLQILEIDKVYSPFKIYKLEELYNSIFTIEIEESVRKVNIKGFIDRIDMFENVYRIIDYKTGKGQNQFKAIGDLFTETPAKRNNSVFQVLLYALMFSEKKPDAVIKPGLYFTREIFNQKFDFHIRQDSKALEDFKSVKKEFHINLMHTLNSLFNMENDFTQTNDLKYCENCPYKSFCKR